MFPASGKASLYSYVINHRPRPDMGSDPHSIAVVTLEEGPRMISNLTGCDSADVSIGMPVEVVFEDVAGDWTLFKFVPAQA